MAKTYTFTDIPQPTACSASAVSGGSLNANTTYYYRLYKVRTALASNDWQGKSLLSDVFSVTTDTTNKTARITFTCADTSGSYRIFRASDDVNAGANLYRACLAFYPTDAIYNSGGTVTFDDNGYALSSNNFSETRDNPHGFLTLGGSTTSDKFSINDLYNADVAGGWGVIEKLDENTYKINTHLFWTNQHWDDTEKTIIFADGVTGQAASLVFGRTGTGSSANRTYGGCNIVIKSTWLSNFGASTITAYRTQFSYIYPKKNSGGDICSGIGLVGGDFSTGNLQDCTIDRFRNFRISGTTANSSMKNVIVSRFDNAFNNSAITFDDVKMLSGSRVWQISGSSTNLTARGVYTEGTSAVLVVNAGGSSLSLIDSNFSLGILVHSASTGFKLLDKISYNLTIVDSDGVAIDTANLKIFDKDGTQLLNVNSNSSGVVAEQFLTRREQEVSGTTVLDYNNRYPFTVVVSKAGYETYTEKVSYLLSAPVVKTIALTPSKQVRQTIDGEVLLALKPELGSSSLLTEI